MPGFCPEKLHVFIDDKLKSNKSIFPRRYTLTHSDFTGDLFLYIGTEYDHKRISNLYSKLMRDEVLGEWANEGQIMLNLYCHCSGGFVIGPEKWRCSIFKQHMPLVLQAMVYGDRQFIAAKADLKSAPVYVNFHKKGKKPVTTEQYGKIEDYMQQQ
ncbi:MAG: hypothetical protein JW997_02355 [Actinobacteria bacterium]|nr:hypothetical protein [Actinomycetota bacterium]